jgi:hypothetical protein
MQFVSLSKGKCEMNKHMFLFSFIVMLLLAPMSLQADETNCVTIQTSHYYAREVHNDYLDHEIELCLSNRRKSVRYELPPLTQPLTLSSSDGFNLSVEIEELDGEEVMRLYGNEVTFSLPTTDGSVRYMMTVEVSNYSDGIITGSIDGEEVGKILLYDIHRLHSDSIVMALGGLSAEWWFAVSDQPEDSRVSMAVISQPDIYGDFDESASGWNRLPELTSDSLVIMGEDWLEGGYFALMATFTH